MRPRSFYAQIFAICFAAILIEIAYTRVFSFKVYYYFTYLIIGIALLGLGAGGVVVATIRRVRESDLRRLVVLCCLGGALGTLLGYPAIALMPLHVSRLGANTAEVLKLAVVSLVLFVPFLAVGVTLGALFAANPSRVNRLYASDLLGAALGCICAVPLMWILSPPGCVMLAGLVLAAAAAPLTFRAGFRELLPTCLIGALLVLGVLAPGVLPDPVTDKGKQLANYREANLLVDHEWTPVFRLDVTRHPTPGRREYVLHHDGMPGSAIRHFDGDLSTMVYLHSDARSLPFSVISRNPRVLVIGSAGGHEVRASLFFNAERVTGVELNPATLSLLTGRFADFAGRIHEAEGVRLIADEGRSFLQRTEETYDLIWLVAPDSYAAMNAASGGAFVLSESYLYTVEMIRESMHHLTDDGVICAQFGELSYEKKPNRTVRYLSTARQALAGEGALDFDRRVFVATSSDMPPFALSTVIVAKTAFTREQVRVLSERTRAITGGVERYKPGDEPGSSPVNSVIRLPEASLAAWYADYPYDVTPVSDDSPFFWKFTRLRDALVPPTDPGPLIDWEDTIGERILLVLLGLVTLLAGIFLVLPLLSLSSVWRRIPYKGRVGLYFAALGVGFMLIEISLIQALTLFLGYPTYSLSVTLFGILTCAGIGSAASGRPGRRLHRSLALLLGALITLVLVQQYAMPTVVRHFVGAPLALRIFLALLMIGPIGFCMGGFLPLGLQVAASVTEHSREYVAWSWAVNGFFSVLSSILATILAMTLGFQAVQIVALGAYALGVVALARVPSGPTSLPRG